MRNKLISTMLEVQRKVVEPDVYRLLMRLDDSAMWGSDAERTEVLLPAVVRVLGMRGDVEARRLRSFRLADVAVSVIAPDALDSAKLPEMASRLRALVPITDEVTATAARDECRKVYADVAGTADAYAATCFAAAAAFAAATAAAAAAAADAYVAIAATYCAASVVAGAAYAAAYAATATDIAAAAADDASDAVTAAAGHDVWRSHVDALLVAAGLADEKGA